MGHSKDYPDTPEWEHKPEGYQTGAMVKYKGNIFKAAFWASEPGEGDPNDNGWRFHDEMYDLTDSGESGKNRIIAYIPTWRKREGFDYAHGEMYRHITHGIVSFLMFSEAALGEFDPASLEDLGAVLPEVVAIGHAYDVKVMVALGGAVDYGFLNLMTAIGDNPASPLLDSAVQKVVDFVNANSLDGVDLDLECWWDKNGDPSKDQGGRMKADGAHPAGYALTHFAERLKQAMPDKLVSAAVFGTSWYGNNYDAKLADHVDWLGLMTYDLTGSWNDSPVGPHSALFKIFEQEAYASEQQGEWPGGGMENNPILSMEDSLWYWTNPMFTNWQGKGQGVPRNKVAFGVPIYGYDFAHAKEPDDLSGQVPPGYKALRYKDILAQFPDADLWEEHGNIKVEGSTPRPPFVNAGGDYPYAHNIYFETPRGAGIKLWMSQYLGTQGVIIWELSNDVWDGEKSIIRRLYQASGNPEKAASPSSSDRWFYKGWGQVNGKDNLFHFAACEDTSIKQRDAFAHTFQIKEGTSYFFATLTKGKGQSDFPVGALLSVRRPDGTYFDSDLESKDQLVNMFGSSVRVIALRDPQPGDWSIEMSAPEGVEFYCQCSAISSRELYKALKDDIRMFTEIRTSANSDGASFAGFKPWDILKPIGDIGEAGVGVIGDIGEVVGEFIGDGVGIGSELIGDGFKHIGEFIGDRFVKVYKVVIDQVEILVIVADEFVERYVELDKLLDDLQNVGFDLVGDLLDGASGGIGKIANIILPGDLGDGIEEVYDKLGDAVEFGVDVANVAADLYSYYNNPEDLGLDIVGELFYDDDSNIIPDFFKGALDSLEGELDSFMEKLGIDIDTDDTLCGGAATAWASCVTYGDYFRDLLGKEPGLLSWNMQGSNLGDNSGAGPWNTLARMIGGDHQDHTPLKIKIACIQECGSVPGSSTLVQRDVNGISGLNKYVWQQGSSSRGGYNLFILHYRWDSKGGRVNQAIVCKEGFGEVAFIPGHLRPLIGVEMGGHYYFSIHASSNGGTDAWSLLRDLQNNAQTNSWTVAGDYNQDPNVLSDRINRNGLGNLVICPPNGATHPSVDPTSRLDYAVRGAGPSVDGSVLPVPGSDHYPVVYPLG